MFMKEREIFKKTKYTYSLVTNTSAVWNSHAGFIDFVLIYLRREFYLKVDISDNSAERCFEN